MITITPQILQKISTTCSGHALKILLDQRSQDISAALQGVKHRVLAADNMELFNDKMATVVTGLEDFSNAEFVCFLSEMDSLRFRNILIFSAPELLAADECQISFKDRMGTTMNQKFMNRVQSMALVL